MFVSLLHIRIDVHAACPCQHCMSMSMLHVPIDTTTQCHCCMAILMLHVHVCVAFSWSSGMSMAVLHVYNCAACPCICMSVMHFHKDTAWLPVIMLVYHACIFFMYILHAKAASPCCMPMEHVHASCPCIHAACPCIHATCPFCVSMLLVHAAGPSCITMLHVHGDCTIVQYSV